MRVPTHITTVGIATLATVVLATVAFAIASPAASGPDDAELPVITTGVSESTPEVAPAADSTAAPLPEAADDAHDAEDDADDHETVVPEVRVEDDDHDETGPSEHAGDGESSEQHDEADDTHQ